MSGRGFSAARKYGLFFQDFDTLFYLLAIFLAFKFGWVANNTFFCGVTNSEHIIDFTLGMGIFGNFLFRSSIGFKND